MANPKYADLPGIAHDQPDIYETNDLPESEQITSEIIVDQSESVEQYTLAPSEAFDKFKGKTLNASNVDFTDRIDHHRRTGYDIRVGDWEMLGEGAKQDETPQQKYQRLQHELRELLEEVNAMKETANKDNKSDQISPVILTQHIEQLQKQLVELNMEHLLGSSAITDLSDPQNALQKKLITQLDAFKEKPAVTLNKTSSKPLMQDTLTYELYVKPEHSKMEEMSKIADLEQRIKHLEAAVGQDKSKLSSLTSHTNEKTIMAAVNILSSKYNLLDPLHLEQIDGRLIVLHQHLQQVAEKKVQVDDIDKQNKISELYDLMKKSEIMSSSLPKIVDRLVALKELHEQALQFSKAMTQLDTVQQQITSTLTSNETLLRELQSTFSRNMEVIKKNIANLDSRISALKK